MTEPAFLSATPRHGLPLLFAGQAQKEVTINESLVLADFLFHCAVEGEREEPPAEPAEGELWLVGANPIGDWSDRGRQVAGWSGGGWRYIRPQTGMRIYDRSMSVFRLYNGSWRVAVKPVEPQGGSVIDAEARAYISNIVAALTFCGFFAAK